MMKENKICYLKIIFLFLFGAFFSLKSLLSVRRENPISCWVGGSLYFSTYIDVAHPVHHSGWENVQMPALLCPFNQKGLYYLSLHVYIEYHLE